MSEFMVSIKQKLLHYVQCIKWSDIQDNFMDVQKVKQMGNSTVKACKALCFSLQIYLQDPIFETYKKMSKITFWMILNQIKLKQT